MAKYKERMDWIGDTSRETPYLIINSEERDVADKIHFGNKGCVHAFIAQGMDVEIPDFYELVGTYHNQIEIYDDHMLMKRYRASIIRIYRAGKTGCIIQLI